MMPVQKEIKQLRQELFAQFSPEKIEEIGRYTGFIQRKRKLTAVNALFLFVFMGKHLSNATLDELCGLFYRIKKDTISSEGLNQRFNEQAVNFLKEIFVSLLTTTLGYSLGGYTKYKAYFQRILVLDSTSFQLPDRFSEQFPGTGCTSIKFQLELDILSGSFTHAHFEAGRTSDVVTGDYLINCVQEKDLILRDLGYLNLEELKKLDEQGSRYFISRLKRNAVVYRKNSNHTYHKNGKPKKKAAYLSFKIGELAQTLDEGQLKEFEDIYVGKDKMKVRLLIYHFPKEEKEKRLKKVTNGDRGRRYDCSERTKKMTAYGFYITNLPQDVLPNEIHELYSLRWQIELLFKSWKSTLDLTQCKPMKIERLYCYFYSQLIQMMLCTMTVYQMRYLLWKKSQKELSEFKGFKAVSSRFYHIYEAIIEGAEFVVQELLLLYEQLEITSLKSSKKGKPNFQQLLGTIN